MVAVKNHLPQNHLRCFQKVNPPVDVVAALDILPSEVEKLHSDYLRLEGREIVNRYFNEIKNKRTEFENICIIIKKYYTDDRMKIRFVKLIELDHIIETMKQKKEETD